MSEETYLPKVEVNDTFAALSQVIDWGPDTPEEDAERWRKVLIKVGVVVAIVIASVSLFKCNKENSEINWDKKFEKEERIIND